MDKEIVELGHDPIPWGSMTACQLCFAQWSKQHRSNIIRAGRCPQVSPWTRIPANLHNPWRLPPQGHLVWKGRPIHPSHSITYYRGVIFCNHCGYYSTGGSVRGLRDTCRLKPLVSQSRLLKRMWKGLFPVSSQDWPEPEDHQIPGYIVTHLIDDELARPTPYPEW